MQMATDVSTVEVGEAHEPAPTLRRDLAVPFYKRLDRVVARKRRRCDVDDHELVVGAPTVSFQGSVFYAFAAAVRLLDVVAAATGKKTRETNGCFTIALIPAAPVTAVGAPLTVTCSAADKETRRRARAVVRDVMAAGLDLFCQRTRAEFTAAFEITTEAQLAVAQREWAWKSLTDDLRLRWAYAAFRLRYLT
jgi:hypothetical protein